MGLPVVATNGSGIADLLTHEEMALFVPDDDDRAMADAVMRLLRQPDLAAVYLVEVGEWSTRCPGTTPTRRSHA